MSTPKSDLTKQVKFETLTAVNWPLFEQLMGEKGGCGGCWCMYFRLPDKDFKQNKHAGNKSMMHQLVKAAKPVGLMAIYKNEAIGWVALSPREDLYRIERSRTLKRIDDKQVWSVSCFFIKKEYRKKGLSQLLIKAVITYAHKNNIATLEAYPVIPYAAKSADVFLWTGILSAFTDNGFKVVKASGRSKTMVRLTIL
jgi:GNAT superfamily N-acetyltransferase